MQNGTYLGIKINLNVGYIQSRDFGHVIVLALALLLLQLERDATDGTTLDTAHQMCGETGNLVAEALGRNDGDLIGNLLVSLEVEREARIIFLDQDAGGLLNSLGTDATLVFVITETPVV